MSGICGLFRTDGRPVAPGDLADMVSPLERRGPERTGIWHKGQAALGHTLLATTPEAVTEHLPWPEAATGCVVTADVRLDNRDAVLADLGICGRSTPIGDGGIILMAYLTWGEACTERLLGDFAFAIWDPRRHALFCARDPFGMRPLYYHYTAGRHFAFASEPKAVLALQEIPYRLNEARIADCLVNELEGIDKTSTCFEGVYRLPPAHSLTVTPDGMRQRRYWAPEPGPELRLRADEDFAEAFLDVFTDAVRCRLRSAGPVGSMLSGGMDTGAVVAVARELLADQGRGPLPTFSAVGPDPATCIETRTIHAALTMPGLAPHLVRLDRLDEFMPELGDLTWGLDEPFDSHMGLIRGVYLAAHRQGLKVLLDGVGGDTVLGEGSYIARLLRGGRWVTAWQEAVAGKHFWGHDYSVRRELFDAARSALAPRPVRQLRRRLLGRRLDGQRLRRRIRDSWIDPAFAGRIGLAARLQRLDEQAAPAMSVPYAAERAQAIEHPYLTVGRERYDRAASAVAVEPRDPFLDRRVVAFCLSLPGDQRLGNGWPKIILRRAMNGRLPDPVRWRTGKEHLGYSFTTALMAAGRRSARSAIHDQSDILYRFVDRSAARAALESYFEDNDRSQAQRVADIACLASWLGRCRARPLVSGRQRRVDEQRRHDCTR